MTQADLDRVAPCTTCGSIQHWFDGRQWICACCSPEAQEYLLNVALAELDQDWQKLEEFEKLDTAPEC